MVLTREGFMKITKKAIFYILNIFLKNEFCSLRSLRIGQCDRAHLRDGGQPLRKALGACEWV